MATLIWEPVGFIGNQVKLRVKMDDDSNMHDAAGGISFIGAINGTNGLIPSFHEFHWSLGFGHQNYNYDDFFVPASQTYMSSVDTQYGDYFGSLGNGYGVVRIGSTHLLPYYFVADKFHYNSYQRIGGGGNWQASNIKCSSWYWEQYGMSAIVHLPIASASSDSTGPIWGNTINASHGQHGVGSIYYFYDHVFGITTTAELFGDAGFTSYYNAGGANQSIPNTAVDNYNILISTVLQISNEHGHFLNIECADSNAIDDTVYLPGGHSTRYAFAPVHFTTSIYDFTPNFVNITSPSYVNEGESAPFQIEIDPRGYRGTMQVYLLDSTSIDIINEEIGTELEEFYGLIQDDVVAQYGTLEFFESSLHHPYIKTIEVTDSSIIEIPILYTASNVNAGQRDTFSIFVRSAQMNVYHYESDLYDAEYQWGLIPTQGKYIYSDNMRIDILDVDQEFVEDYDPSDNLIIQPADIIHHLLSEELGFDKNKIDTVSKLESREQNEGLNLAFSINKQIEGKKLIKEISQSFKSIPSLSNDILKFINIKDTYTGDEDIFKIKADDVLKYSFSRTPIEDVKTKVNIKYRKDYGIGNHLDSYEITVHEASYFATSNYGDYSQAGFTNYYGVKAVGSKIDHVDTFLDVENDYIRDNLSAAKLAHHLLQWHKNQHNIVSLTLPLTYYGFEVGDLIDFDKMIEGRKLYGENYVLSDKNENGNYLDMPIRCGQYIIPLFMITETSKSLDSISIKAIQLHHQSGTMFNWENAGYDIYQEAVYIPSGDTSGGYIGLESDGSGDINNDGLTNVMDVVAIITNIINVQDFTEEETALADTNFDGLVNVMDVVIIVNRIIAS